MNWKADIKASQEASKILSKSVEKMEIGRSLSRSMRIAIHKKASTILCKPYSSFAS